MLFRSLVQPEEGASGSRLIRSGDEIIVTARDLYDGKVVGYG